MKIVAGAVSDKGNFKVINQDNLLISIYGNKKDDAGLFVICDGVGGLSHGEVASSISVKFFKDWFNEKYEFITKEENDTEILSSLENTLNSINVKIIKYGDAVSSRVGTTVSALLLCNNKYFIVHVGDTRIYKINRNLIQLTEDHTFVAVSVKNKIMTKEEARINPKRNVLTQCIGVKKNINIYKKCGRVSKNDIFVLCCDGFYNRFPEWELYNQMKKLGKHPNNDEFQNAAERFVNEVKNRGETDNISAILVGINKNDGILSKLKKHIFN